ncbi:NlpC/P60 family protein, partial [Listeria ivanovii FSL F6-596]
DLLFFAYEEGKGDVHHVGVYMGNDEMIHSQTPGSKVILTKITGSKYEPELCVISRHR